MRRVPAASALALLGALCACASPPPPAAAPPPSESAAPPPPARSALDPRPEGRCRHFYLERFQDNFLTRRALAAAPALQRDWPEAVAVHQELAAYQAARGELGITIGLDTRTAVEDFPRGSEELLAQGRVTVILGEPRGEPPFTRAERDALQARLAAWSEVRVVRREEISPPPALLARQRALEARFDEDALQAALVRAVNEAPLAEWEAYLGEPLHVGDLIDYEPSRYRGVWTLIVGRRLGPTGPEPCVLVPFHGGEFYVTPPHDLTGPDRIPFGYWSADGAVDCFPVQHAWLRAHTAGGQVQVDGVTYPVTPEAERALADDDGPFQVYACPGAGELWLFQRRTTLGER